MADAAAIAAAIDAGHVLSEQQHLDLLHSAANAAQQQQGAAQSLHEAVNSGAHPLPRVVVLPPQGAVPAVGVRGLIEEHLIALNTAQPNRLGVIVVMPEALQAHKKRRGGLPDGVTYEGSSFGGRCAWRFPGSPRASVEGGQHICTLQHISLLTPDAERIQPNFPALQGWVSAISEQSGGADREAVCYLVQMAGWQHDTQSEGH